MTTLLVSTVGGHLAQLHDLLPRLTGIDTSERMWVTHRTEQSESLLLGEEVHWVPYIEERDLLGVVRAFAPALRLVRSRSVGTVVSTGSAIAVAYLGAARALRRRAVFIESTAFLSSRSRTARIVQHVPGVATFTQSVPLATGKWRYQGSVLDSYTAIRDGRIDVPKRLVVTVGTSRSFGFRRLLERLIAIVPTDVEVTWQTGATNTEGLGIDATPWIPFADLSTATCEADAVVAHAGGGSTLTALAAGRRPLLVPRAASAGDFNDDHQHEIALHLGERELALVRDVDSLTWDDIVETSKWRIERLEEPAAFDIGGGQ